MVFTTFDLYRPLNYYYVPENFIDWSDFFYCF